MSQADFIEIPLGDQKSKAYRLLETLPGVLSWTIILLPWILAIFSATASAAYVIAIMVYWLIKTVTLTIRVVLGYRLMRMNMKLDWQERLDALEEASKSNDQILAPSKVKHLVFIAAYNEAYEVLQPTVEMVKNSAYDLKKIVLVLAYEQRGGPAIKKTMKRIAKEYKGVFSAIELIEHPEGLPDEVIGKGGNITYAAKQFEKNLELHGIRPDRCLVTTLDSDNRPHKHYLSAITYEYCQYPDRKHLSFQPLAMYLNNIWDVPAPMRVIATGNSFFQMIQSTKPHLLRNFSAHAQPLDALMKMNYWSVRTIVEDGHQFWRSFFAFKGRYDVVPIHVPIYQDAVLSDTFMKTLKAQFVQIRRWAYGASDVPYVALKGFSRKSGVGFGEMIAKFARLVESHVTWFVIPFILSFASWAPRLVNPGAGDSIVAWRLPDIALYLNTALTTTIFLSIFVSILILPPRPARYKKTRLFWLILQWIWVPVVSIAYGGLAAMNSQTRLLLGKYLDKFDVTDKFIKK